MSEATTMSESEVAAQAAAETAALFAAIEAKRAADAAALVIAAKASEFKEAQEVSKSKWAAFVASLPMASDAQLQACVVAARDIEIPLAVSTVATGLNQKFRLSDGQKEQVSAARAEHIKVINEPGNREMVTKDVTKCARLTSYKLRVRKSDGKVTLSVSGVM